jgi:RNA polymerase sigma factor (sigma-70 family)
MENHSPPVRDDDFATLMDRIKEGSDEAFHELVDKYGRHVLRAVRRNLNHSLRSKFDSADFVQAVWASFFESRQRILEFPTAGALVEFLSQMARNKVTDESRRRLMSQGANVNRELPLQSLPDGPGLVSKGPTASECVMAAEQMQWLAAGQPSQSQRIIELMRDGATQGEIAAALGVAPRTIRRVLRRLRHRSMP